MVEGDVDVRVAGKVLPLMPGGGATGVFGCSGLLQAFFSEEALQERSEKEGQ